MKNKKILSVALAGVMLASLSTSVFAAEESGSGTSTSTTELTEEQKAEKERQESEERAREREAERKRTNFSVSEREHRNGRFYGRVTDLNGDSVYGAKVKVYVNGSLDYTTETDSDGNFDFSTRYYDRDYNWRYNSDWRYDYYDGYRVYEDSKGYYILENGDKRYVSYDPYYRSDYKVDIRVEKDGFTPYEKNLWNYEYNYRYPRYNKNDTRVYPSSISRTNYSTSGYLRDYKNTTVYVYDGDLYLGSDRTDSDGYFKVSWNSPYISESRSLEYYVGVKKVEKEYSTTPEVSVARPGTNEVIGTAGKYTTVTVYDSNGNKLGSTTTSDVIIYSVKLSRNLVSGETIKVEAKENDSKTSTKTHTVTGTAVEAAVETVAKPSYISGYPDGTFKPGASVTRAEAVRMFVTLLNDGAELSQNSTTQFKDANNAWYSDEINYAVSKGFIKGYSDGTFKPDKEITRAEFATMISVFVKDGYPGNSNFKDVKGHWASDAINELYGNKVVSGYSDGTFKPDQQLTRAEAVVILNSTFGRNTKASSLTNVNTNSLTKFSDVPASHWAYYEILDASNGHRTQKTEKTDEVNIWK